MKLIISEQYDTDELKLKFCFRLKAQMRRMHNVIGAWYREGSIDQSVYDSLPSELRDKTTMNIFDKAVPAKRRLETLDYLREAFHSNRLADLSIQAMCDLEMAWVKSCEDNQVPESEMHDFILSSENDETIQIDFDTVFTHDEVA
jgi:hypothetical protein